MCNLVYDVLAAHQLWLESSGGYGERANLLRADLSGADLSGADLSEADLSWADLRLADLSRADLSRADLSGADLRWASLLGADLSGADLSGADLSGADLSGADLRGADLSEAIGNGDELRTLILHPWIIAWCPATGQLAIGCQQHSIDSWESFGDEEISAMHHVAVEWWAIYKIVIMQLVKMP